MKTKFNALMVNEADKVTVQNLREKFQLTEKQVVNLLIDVATENADVLEARAAELNEQLEANKASHKNQKMAEYKQKATAKRKVQSVEKLKAKLAVIEGGEPEPAGDEVTEAGE